MHKRVDVSNTRGILILGSRTQESVLKHLQKKVLAMKARWACTWRRLARSIGICSTLRRGTCKFLADGSPNMNTMERHQGGAQRHLITRKQHSLSSPSAS